MLTNIDTVFFFFKKKSIAKCYENTLPGGSIKDDMNIFLTEFLYCISKFIYNDPYS